MKIAEVHRVGACRLRLSDNDWQYAEERQDEISALWSTLSRKNSSFFNGRVLVMESYDLADCELDAKFIETDFANFLYWREQGFPAAGVLDAFGSALIRARGGEVLMARQSPGHVNSGRIYMPGGFIDPRDVGAGGEVDIDGSVLRELHEETGIEPGELDRVPGYLVTCMPRQVSIAIEFTSSLEAGELRNLLVERIARQTDPELDDFVIYSDPPDAADDSVVEFCRHALLKVLGPDCSGSKY